MIGRVAAGRLEACRRRRGRVMLREGPVTQDTTPALRSFYIVHVNNSNYPRYTNLLLDALLIYFAVVTLAGHFSEG
jgi:hypothetical protein